MEAANKITLDFSENPELQAALGGKEPGDKITLEITVMVTSVDESKLEGTVEEIVGDAGEEPSEVSADEPVMVMLSKKAGKKGPSKDEPADDSAESDTSDETDKSTGY